MKLLVPIAMLLGLATTAAAQWTGPADGFVNGPTVNGVQLAFTCDEKQARSLFRFDAVPELPQAEELDGHNLYHAHVKVGRFRQKIVLKQQWGSHVLIEMKGTSHSHLRNLRLFKTFTLVLAENRSYSFPLEGSKEPLRELVNSCKG